MTTSPLVIAPAAVAAADLVKVYGSGDTAVYALGGVTASFATARFTAIMGPAAPQPRRLCLPVVQPAARADRRTEHPAAAGPGRAAARAGLVGSGHRPPRPGGPARAPAQRAVRRPAAAGRLRAGADHQAGRCLR